MMEPIQPKPQGAHWTDDQWQAISQRGNNLLVAAAAGSGKTAVLVERIIRRITDVENPVDVDQLLVATFTKAAADEMRHRIREALEQQLEGNKGDQHLLRQLALLSKAPITTLHSFCLEVTQANAYKLPIDPVFRIANETEAELLQAESLEELFEGEYAKPDNETFIRLVDAFGGERSDSSVFVLVLKLYQFSRSHPWPDEWLNETAARFVSPDTASSVWFEQLLNETRDELEGIILDLRSALDSCLLPGGPVPYEAALREDMEKAGKLLQTAEAGEWDLLKEAFDGLQFARLKACRGDQYDPILVESVKKLRNDAKDRISKLREELFLRTVEEYISDILQMAPLVDVLTQLVKQFGERYGAKKQDKGLIDFNDLEHYCLQVLLDEGSTPACPLPSAVAIQISNQFAEVLLDEYQDTNRVQETIVQLISRPEGNRFMVGDVKQSIYRFRLAEPALFQSKYKDYVRRDGGTRIDLAQNFRSRREVVSAVNYIFRQIMFEQAAEIEYDDQAALRFGAGFYDESSAADQAEQYEVELFVADRQALSGHAGGAESRPEHDDREEQAAEEDQAADLETVQVEARMMGQRILELMGGAGRAPFQVYDKALQGYRSLTYRDIVILLRATQQWAPVIIEELRNLGIPAYADLSTGYFMATEIQVMMSLLKVIDNPQQDIPLAGVLRSPMFRFTAEELARIRLMNRHSDFYHAVRATAQFTRSNTPDQEGRKQDEQISENLRLKTQVFMEKLQRWRTEARQGTLAALIWRIYRETGYYDLVGGLPGGMQRQANLRALYDRARQYEATTLRGLFRFLRFIERMQDTGADLGAARALGEQEDVVRIMSIHKSKGLEFPVVLLAGLSKSFNQQDLRQSFLLHKELGLGPKYIDAERRISMPSLAWLAIRRRLKSEMLAEEMRILYVALTRAREKLILVTAVRQLENEAEKWRRLARNAADTLPVNVIMRANCYADWIFPALSRHPQLHGFQALGGEAADVQLLPDVSSWRLTLAPVEGLVQAAAAPEPRTEQELQEMLAQPPQDHERNTDMSWLDARFAWQYPHKEASSFLSKITVTEIKRLSESQLIRQEMGDEEGSPDRLTGKPAFTLLNRPSFLEAAGLTAAERGTAYHTVMQHVPLNKRIMGNDIQQLLEHLVTKQILAPEQADIVDVQQVATFYASPLGERIMQADTVYREQPFSYRLSADEVYPEAGTNAAQESMLIQGVIDCLFLEGDEFILVDYKTDAMKGRPPEEIAARYDTQLRLYARAVSDIWRKRVKEAYLYFFDGAVVLDRSSIL